MKDEEAAEEGYDEEAEAARGWVRERGKGKRASSAGSQSLLSLSLPLSPSCVARRV